MSAGDPWLMPSGRKALELPGSTRDYLRVAVIVEGWPYPESPRTVVRALCKRLPSRYLGGAIPQDEVKPC